MEIVNYNINFIWLPAGISLEVAIPSQKIKFIMKERILLLNPELRTKEELYNIFEQIES
jgi:hypothetical protein